MLYIRTKTDANGNSYYFIIDVENRRFCEDYNLAKAKEDCIEISKKEYKKTRKLLELAGYDYFFKWGTK